MLSVVSRPAWLIHIESWPSTNGYAALISGNFHLHSIKGKNMAVAYCHRHKSIYDVDSWDALAFFKCGACCLLSDYDGLFLQKLNRLRPTQKKTFFPSIFL